MNRSMRVRIARAEQAVRAAGFELRYVDRCEDTETPGLFPGLYAGVTDRAHLKVKIRKAMTIRSVIWAEVLEHELHHVLDPDWDCGNHVRLLEGSIEVGNYVPSHAPHLVEVQRP